MKVITNISEISEFVEALKECEWIGFDIESTGLNPWLDTWLLLQLNLQDKIFIFDVVKFGEKNIRYIIQLIVGSNKVCIGHNIKFDMRFVYLNTGELLLNVYDTMIVETILCAGLGRKYPSLAELVDQYCHVVLDKEVRKEFIGAKDITARMLIYSAEDVKYLNEIREKQMKIVTELKLNRIVNEIEMPVLPVITAMELEGIGVDINHWNNLLRIATENRDRVRTIFMKLVLDKLDVSVYSDAAQLADSIGIPIKTKRDRKIIEQIKDISFMTSWFVENLNVSSNKQVFNILQKYFNLPIEGTNEKVLLKFINNDIVKILLEYREYEKKITTYGDKFISLINPYDNRIHTEYNQTGASTGRLSSDEPNLQNIPADSKDTPLEESYRRGFIAKEDHVFICADYNQAEFRLMGAVSGEKNIIQAYLNNIDVHKVTASIIYKKSVDEINSDERRRGKTLNFAVIYGTTEWGLEFNFGIPLAEGRILLKNYFDGYPELRDFVTYAGEMIWNKKYSITPMGRKRFFESKVLFESTWEQGQYIKRVKREGVNHIIQGGSADIVKLAMINVFYKNPFGEKLKLLLQVHDELVLEVHKSIVEDAKKFVEECMLDAERPYLGEIPPAVDVHSNYYWSKEDESSGSN